MASAKTVNESINNHLSAADLGFLNGLLLGLALVVGVWGWEAINLVAVPVAMQYPSLIAAGLLLIMGFGLTGWLTGRLESAGWVLIIWLTTAVLSTFVITYQPTFGRTLTIWIADRRTWGLPVYPYAFGSLAAPILAGFFVILVLVILALLQNYRLESAGNEVNANGRLQIRGWYQLLIPLPFVFLVGMTTRNIVGNPVTGAVQTVQHAIERTLEYEGDLFALGLQEGVNYSAFNAVRDQLSPNYTLAIGGLEPETAITYIVIHFDNGAWVNCRLISDTLSFCSDAAPPYTIGFSSLLTGQALPEPCHGCLPRVDDEWQTWLRTKGAEFTEPPQIQRRVQWGGYVLMRAETDDYAVECWFSGISPVQLDSCETVAP